MQRPGTGQLGAQHRPDRVLVEQFERGRGHIRGEVQDAGKPRQVGAKPGEGFTQRAFVGNVGSDGDDVDAGKPKQLEVGGHLRGRRTTADQHQVARAACDEPASDAQTEHPESSGHEVARVRSQPRRRGRRRADVGASGQARDEAAVGA